VGLNTGTKLGPYEILSPLGAGGMGEVYRARDTKLNRDVALKVLPETVSNDPQRMARFEREAQVLASLNHPNIAAIYGLEESGPTRALVMELVEGQTLAEIVAARRGITVSDALPIAKQIADALEYAHERGIIHRDLKPANVKVTPEGTVKVLDFGLAKALDADASGSNLSNSPTLSPTLSVAATQAGVILGTAAYMSPEQAKAKNVDRRTDVWAFGCVLYEMLAGKRTFEGEDLTETVVALMRNEPDWSALPADTPLRIRDLIRRCLVKDPKQRLQAIGEARIAIEETISGVGAIHESPRHADGEIPPRQARQHALAWGILGLFAGILVTGIIFKILAPKPQPQPVRHLSIMLPPGLSMASQYFPELALSPDGTDLVFSAVQDGKLQLYQRHMDDFEPQPIAGTEGGLGPVLSPDGQSVAFVLTTGSGDIPELRKIPLAGGPVQTLCSGYDNYPGSWSSDGNIYFTNTHFNGLMQVPAAGGNCQDLTKPDIGRGEASHFLPQPLPGGDSLLFVIGRGFGTSESSIAVLSLKTGKWQTLIREGENPHYVPGGYLVYSQSSTLMAVPFDVKTLKMSGSPVPVLEDVLTNPTSGANQLAISGRGTLAYIAGTEGNRRQIVLVDRSGKPQVLTKSEEAYEDLDLSPDGREIAMTVEGPRWGIWTYDIPRGILSRFTFDNDNRDPFWSPDGKRIAYTSLRNGKYGIYWKPANGSGSEELLLSSPDWITVSSFSPDGKELAFNRQSPDTGLDIWILPLDGKGKPQPFLQTRFTEEMAEFSPDGHWLAYDSNESGRSEVYVQQYPGPGGKWQISNEGGMRPVWSRDGRELFYRNGNKLMAVPIETKPAFTPGTPHLLWEGEYFISGHYYDVMPGAKQFLFIKQVEQPHASTQINVILNWFDELKRLMAVQSK
jgi:eukaryotic-like serine/threonine-protein kinase